MAFLTACIILKVERKFYLQFVYAPTMSIYTFLGMVGLEGKVILFTQPSGHFHPMVNARETIAHIIHKDDLLVVSHAKPSTFGLKKYIVLICLMN